MAGTVLTISFILVLKPLHDARVTDRNMKLAMSNGCQVNPETVASCGPLSPSRQQVDDDVEEEQVVDELGSGDHRPRDMGGGTSQMPSSRSSNAAATLLHARLVDKVSVFPCPQVLSACTSIHFSYIPFYHHMHHNLFLFISVAFFV